MIGKTKVLLLQALATFPIVTIFFMFFGLLAPKTFKIIWLSNFLTLSVPEESYSRKGVVRIKFYIYVFIPLISQYRTLISALKSSGVQKRPRHMAMDIQFVALDRHTNFEPNN